MQSQRHKIQKHKRKHQLAFAEILKLSHSIVSVLQKPNFLRRKSIDRQLKS